MRPARKGPENERRRGTGCGGCARFNEAGPQGAGKLDVIPHEKLGPTRFNEAGPQGAGKRHALDTRDQGITASMRPARKGPENVRAPLMDFAPPALQ